MIRRPPRSTLDRSSAASDVYKRQAVGEQHVVGGTQRSQGIAQAGGVDAEQMAQEADAPRLVVCLLYTSDAADERSSVDLGGRRIIKKKTQQKD